MKYPTKAQASERRAWSESFDWCWVCGKSSWRLETHEIASRAQAPGKWADVRNYLRTCGRCHSEILSWIGESWQLALKAVHDPENYDRQFVNELRGRAKDSIAEYEVRLRKKLWCVIQER